MSINMEGKLIIVYCIAFVLLLTFGAGGLIIDAYGFPYHWNSPGYYNLPNDYYFSPFMPYYNNHNDLKYYEDMTRDHTMRGEFKTQYYETYENPFLYPNSLLSPYITNWRSVSVTDNCWYWGC